MAWARRTRDLCSACDSRAICRGDDRRFACSTPAPLTPLWRELADEAGIDLREPHSFGAILGTVAMRQIYVTVSAGQEWVEIRQSEAS